MKYTLNQFSDPENRRKAGVVNIGVIRNGKKHTDEVRQKMSLSRKGRVPRNKGKKTGKDQKEYKE